MKLNKKVVDLISEGFKANTLKNLTETQIDKLHDRVIKKEPKEQTTKITQTKVTTGEIGKPVPVTPDPTKPKITAIPQGNKVIVKQETTEGDKKRKVNPWAICTDSVGREDKKKYERCVQDVKKKNKGNLDLEEEKLDESLFIEKKILNLVEKYTTPKMSKKEFLSLLESSETKEKPDVKEKPGIKEKPGTKEKPHDPFKPAPHKQPKPKAKKKEVDENAVMDAPAKPKEPTTKPGTKTPPREKPHDPFKPAPHKQPKPKAGRKLPDQLKFNAIGIKFKK